MKLVDALRRVDKSEAGHDPKGRNWQHYLSFESLCDALGISWQEEPVGYETRVKAYPVIKWICTDTHVGLEAIYFDGELVGCYYQQARKCDKEWEWVSQEAVTKLYQYIVSHNETKYPLLDPEQDIGEFYTVSYASQLLDDEGIYNGNHVTVVKPVNRRSITESMITVSDDAGKEHRINIKDFHISFHFGKDEADA